MATPKKVVTRKSFRLCPTRSFLLLVEPPELRPVPAQLDIAPPPPVILARIQKKPLTSFRRTGTDISHILRCQQVRRRTRNRPHWPQKIIGCVFVAPLEMSLCRRQFKMLRRILYVLIQREQRCRRRRLPVHECPENFIH